MAAQAKRSHPPLCLFVLINLVQAFQGLSINHDPNVTASPGENITLKCSLSGGKSTSVVQIQWSKEIGDHSGMVILANRFLGISRSMESVEFESKSPNNGTGNIRITNVQASDSGTYTCSLVTFPNGSLKVSIILTVIDKADLQEDAVESPIVLEVMLNSTILIPCGPTAAAKQGFTLEWFTKKNGILEKLIHANSLVSEINNSSQYKDRIHLGMNYSLYINSILAVDDGDFICQVVTSHGSGTNITTKVNVFAEPTIPQIHEELEYFGLNKLHLNATCISRKAYPEPNITLYLNGFPLQDGDNGSVITSEVFLDSNGLYEVKKRLSLKIKPDQWKLVWCNAVFSLPGNKSGVVMQSRKIPLHNYLDNIEFTPEGPYEVFLEEDLNILCFVNSSVTPRYRWIKVNGTVSNSNLLTLKNITEETAGKYICDADVPGTNLHRSSYITVTIKGTESYISTDLTTRIALSIGTDSSTILGDSTITGLSTSAGLPTNIQSSTTFGPSINIAPSNSPGPSITIEGMSTTIESSISFGPSNSTESSMENTEIPINKTKSYITINYLNRTNTIGNTKANKEPEGTVSVAVVVTVILILVICTALLSYLIRYWQVRKKLNGPPPFKPPPPPIKYAAIHVSPQDEVN
ncbi:T-cell surface protein tactile-like [Heptranchias perlo]|uniref:T-cell surface protein tactile-like n=1 Tax=Heptranchias perlo TaxID=212740 RepID=UPI00355A054F